VDKFLNPSYSVAVLSNTIPGEQSRNLGGGETVKPLFLSSANMTHYLHNVFIAIERYSYVYGSIWLALE
jgi:hypothetical protein